MPDWLLDEAGLAIVRRAYARQMLATANVRNDRLEQVFATIRREGFLAPHGALVRDADLEPLLRRGRRAREKRP